MRDLYGLGSIVMLRPACRKVTADNSGCVHGYYVRCAKADAARFSFRERWEDGDLVRGLTEALSVPTMHALAGQIRKEGGGIFFAAVE